MALQIWEAGEEFFIAESAEDARSMHFEMLGKTDSRPGDEYPGDELSDWEAWPEDKTFKLTDEDTGAVTVLLPAEWAKREGRSYLGSGNL